MKRGLLDSEPAREGSDFASWSAADDAEIPRHAAGQNSLQELTMPQASHGIPFASEYY